MTLYFIGIGLNDEKDISLKGLEIVKKSDVIYLESYTSTLNIEISKLEKLYDKKIILADRDLVEKQAENTILKNSESKIASFLVIGDSMAATTHSDLYLRAKKLGIEIKIIHNASILTAVGITGLELYKFGKTTSIPFNNKDVKSPIEVLKNNQKLGLHTLFLLDLDPKNKKYLTIKEAIEYLLENKVKDQKAIACAAIGSDKPFIKYDTLNNLKEIKINKFPQCLIIPSKLHFMEEGMLENFSL